MHTIARALVTVVLLIAIGSSVADARPRRYRQPHTMRMTATAYCDRGPTKSGVNAQRGVAAADLRRFPIGTRLRVIAPGEPYAGVYTVLDSGSAIKGRDLDIFMRSCRNAKRFGRRPVQVRILDDRTHLGDRGGR